MATIKRFEDLEIWMEARRLSFCIFEMTQKSRLTGTMHLKTKEGLPPVL